MIEFKRKERDYRIEMRLLGADYVVNVPATSEIFLKKINAARKEGMEISEKAKVTTDIDEAFVLLDKLMAKNREVIDMVLPGKWDDIYVAAEGDIEVMSEVVVFVVHNIMQSANKAKLADVAPVEGNGEEV